MDENSGNTGRDHLRLHARQLGELLSQVGDFYDITEEIAIGYASGTMGSSWPPPSPAYTTGPQAGQPPAASIEPNSAADQENSRRLRERHVLLQLGALNELRSVANSITSWRVDDARDLLASWSQIGQALDISKQAATQRFGAAARGYKEISGDIKGI
jgi:hypothetical protein